jgi:hypothetical protein
MLTQFRTILLFNLIISFVLGACSALPSAMGESNNVPASPLQLDLALQKLPELGEEVLLTATIHSIHDTLDAHAQITLPEGAMLVDGNLAWQGDLKAEIPVHLEAVIIFTEEGDWTIRADTQKIIDELNSMGDTEHIYLHVSVEGSHYGFESICPDPLVAVHNAVKVGEESDGVVQCESRDLRPTPPPPSEPTPISRSGAGPD